MASAPDDEFLPASDERAEELVEAVSAVESRDYTADELADAAEDTAWIVEGLVPARAQLIMAGDAKRGRKTLLAMHLAKCVSQGLPFLGREVARRPVIYVALEGGRNRMGMRWRNFGFGGERTASDLDRGALVTRFGIAGYERTLDALQSSEVLVIVDPLIRVTANRGVDENDPVAVTNFLYQHEERIGIGPGATLLWLHHFRKSRDVMRGSTAYEAGTDGWWENHRTDDPGVNRIEVTLRDGEDAVLGARFVVGADGLFSFDAEEAPSRRRAREGPDRSRDRESASSVNLLESDTREVRQALYDQYMEDPAVRRSVSQGWYDFMRARGSLVSKTRVRRALEALGTKGELEGSGGTVRGNLKLCRAFEREAEDEPLSPT